MCTNKQLLIYSNIIFVIGFIYLLFNDKKKDSLLLLFIGIISLLYHIYETNNLYALDILAGVIVFIYIYCNYKEFIYYLPLIILFIYYCLTFIIYYKNRIIHAYMHSLWHILVCIYIVYIIMQK